MGWELEIFKMFVYISFPVGIFHYVNQPEFFDKYVTKIKEKHYPLQSKKMYEEMDNFIREFNADAEKARLDTMEKQHVNR